MPSEKLAEYLTEPTPLPLTPMAAGPVNEIPFSVSVPWYCCSIIGRSTSRRVPEIVPTTRPLE